MFLQEDDIVFQNKGGGITQRILGYTQHLMAVEMTFQKGSTVDLHHHPNHTQGIYIVKGKFEISCAGEKRIMVSGDCCYAKASELHGTLALEDNSILLDMHTPMRQDILDEGIKIKTLGE